MKSGIFGASLVVAALGLATPARAATSTASDQLAAHLVKVTEPGWTYTKGDAAMESSDLIKEMKSTYTGTLAAAARTWAPPSAPSQFVNVSLVAYLHLTESEKNFRKLVSKDAWVLCRGVGSKSTVSTSVLRSTGDGLVEHCRDGQAGAVFAKANVLAFIGMNAPNDPTAVTRIAVAQYEALPAKGFNG